MMDWITFFWGAMIGAFVMALVARRALVKLQKRNNFLRHLLRQSEARQRR